MKTQFMHTLFLSFLLWNLSACGGSQSPIIKHTIALEALAQTPLQARSPVADAYRAHYLSQIELDHSSFLLKDIDYEIQIAKGKAKEIKGRQELGKIDEKRNNAMFKLAAATNANSLVQSLKKQHNDQRKHITYLKSQRSYLRKQVQYFDAKQTHSLAQFELAKAKLAQKQRILPKNFQMNHFVAQEKKAEKQLRKREKVAKAAKSKALDQRQREAKDSAKNN